MTDIFDTIAALQSQTETKPLYVGSVVNFSNTRGNWFAISVPDLIGILSDIRSELAAFTRAGSNYDETRWRTAFATHLKNDVSRALAGTQTNALFRLLGKIVASANDPSAYIDNRISLDATEIDRAIESLRRSVTEIGPTRAGGTEVTVDVGERIEGGRNLLYYGAPGTGKSHAVEKLAKGELGIRTIFHPDTQNADFVGSLKPAVTGEDITYRFSPGPFSRALSLALKSPSKRVFLIIEELNRAPAAAVFGELFQLLDREPDGSGNGRYPVSFPSEECESWFEYSVGSKQADLRLPSNLWICATMNSADQGVYSLDTAFRRRWEQIYVPVDYEIAPSTAIMLALSRGAQEQVAWRLLVERLNAFLVNKLDVPEDRLVGPRFVDEGEIDAAGHLPSKVLIYLWDDLLRHGGRDRLFAQGIRLFGDLHRRSIEGDPIFSEEFLQSMQPDSSLEETTL